MFLDSSILINFAYNCNTCSLLSIKYFSIMFTELACYAGNVNTNNYTKGVVIWFVFGTED